VSEVGRVSVYFNLDSMKVKLTYFRRASLSACDFSSFLVSSRNDFRFSYK